MCMLRQQVEKESSEDPYFCQSDFVAPKDSGVADYMGVRFCNALFAQGFLSDSRYPFCQMFAAACFGCDVLVAKHEANNDDYSKIMAQVHSCPSSRCFVVI